MNRKQYKVLRQVRPPLLRRRLPIRGPMPPAPAPALHMAAAQVCGLEGPPQ